MSIEEMFKEEFKDKIADIAAELVSQCLMTTMALAAIENIIRSGMKNKDIEILNIIFKTKRDLPNVLVEKSEENVEDVVEWIKDAKEEREE